MRTKIYHLCILSFLFFTAFSQDHNFLNPTQSLINLNPSFAGSNGGLRDQLTYQRSDLGYVWGPHQSVSNSVDAYIKPLKAGIALSYLYDSYSPRFKNSLVNLTYAQHLSFFDHQLKIIPSLQTAFVQKNAGGGMMVGDIVDPEMNLVWYDKSMGAPVSQKQYFNLSTGLLVNYKNLYVGASVFNINRPDAGQIGVFKLPVCYSANASYNFHVSEGAIINVSGRYLKQASYNYGQLHVNAVFAHHFIVGLGASVSKTTDYPFNLPSYSNLIDYIRGSPAMKYASATIGYRCKLLSASLSYTRPMDFSSQSGSFGASLGFYVPNKSHEAPLRNFEAW